jgi:hypothetical protein
MIIPGDNILNLTSVVFHCFQGSIYEADKNQFLMNRAILTSLNKDVSVINSILLSQFDGEAIDLYSADSLNNVDDMDNLRYPVEFLNKIDSGSLPPHHLRLKVGCPIMILRNLDPTNGLCNGTRLICLNISRYTIKAEIATGSRIDQIALIPRIKLESNAKQIGIDFQRIQFPIRLAFAMTINKSQGQTLDYVGLYLPSPVFSHGQLYVAMSRVKTPTSLKLLIAHTDKNNTSEKNTTDNVVYKEVFI